MLHGCITNDAPASGGTVDERNTGVQHLDHRGRANTRNPPRTHPLRHRGQLYIMAQHLLAGARATGKRARGALALHAGVPCHQPSLLTTRPRQTIPADPVEHWGHVHAARGAGASGTPLILHVFHRLVVLDDADLPPQRGALPLLDTGNRAVRTSRRGDHGSRPAVCTICRPPAREPLILGPHRRHREPHGYYRRDIRGEVTRRGTRRASAIPRCRADDSDHLESRGHPPVRAAGDQQDQHCVRVRDVFGPVDRHQGRKLGV